MELIEYLREKNIKHSLSECGLKINGGLNLTGNKVISLPHDLISVRFYLDLTGTQIKSLPDNLQVGTWIDLTDTPIKELPKGLKFGAVLYHHFFFLGEIGIELRIDREDWFEDINNPSQEEINMLELMTNKTWLNPQEINNATT